MTEPAAPTPASEAFIYGVPVAALIALLGVLVIGLLQAGVNRQLHKERLKREAINDRRLAWNAYLATWYEGPGVRLKADLATQEHARGEAIVNQANPTRPGYDHIVTKVFALQDAMWQAISERDAWQSRLIAQQMTAIASVSDVKSPLLLIPKLMSIPQDEQTSDIWLMMIEAMRADQYMSNRKRRKAEEEVRDKITKLVIERELAPQIELLQQQLDALQNQSPSGAGRQGTDSESTSETEGEEGASIDNDGPGSPPGDRQ